MKDTTGLPDDKAREIQRRIAERERRAATGEWKSSKSDEELKAEAAEVERENDPDRPLPGNRLSELFTESSPKQLSKEAADFVSGGCSNEAPSAELLSAEDAASRCRDISQDERLRKRAHAPLIERGKEQLGTLKKAREAKRRKRSYGSKADDPKVKKAQEAVNGINTAAEEWAKGNRRQVIKEMLAFRGAREQNDGTVKLTKTAVLSRVARMTEISESTLRDWVKVGWLARVPPAQNFRKKK
ncbi:MAG: hypothetical protein ABSF77_05295 [Spirochaetia bacterium]|jgi:hypothetical protein